MQREQTEQIIVEIDEQIALLIEEINTSSEGDGDWDFVDACKDVIIESLVGPFGLSRTMFVDKDGGNVTTVHNFKIGIVATEEDARRYDAYKQALQNPDYDGYRSRMGTERRRIFEENEQLYDAYTGRELEKDSDTHIDHVIPVAEIEQSAEAHLAQTREERENAAYSPENLVPTHRRLNLYKNKSDLLEWMKEPSKDDPSLTNEEAFGMDRKRSMKVYRRARKAVVGQRKIARLKKQSRELLQVSVQDAGKLALRQVIGLFLKDLAEGIVDDVRALMRQGVQSLSELVNLVRARIEKTVETIKTKWKDYLHAGVNAGITGFVYNLVTLLINSLWTTAKNIVRVIREGTLAVVKAVRTIVSPPAHMSKAEIAAEVLKILSGAIVVVIGIGLEEVIKKGIEAIPPLAPFAGIMAPVITGIITGIGALLVVWAFDKLRDRIKFQYKQLANIHREHTVVLLEIKKTVFIVQQAHDFIHSSTEALHQKMTSGWQVLKELGQATDAALDKQSTTIRQLKSLSEAF